MGSSSSTGSQAKTVSFQPGDPQTHVKLQAKPRPRRGKLARSASITTQTQLLLNIE